MTLPPKKFSVSVGIPAFNEGKNIVQLLRSLLEQKGENFELENIMVISDGSTDTTAPLIRELSLAHPKIKFFAESERLGQAARLNQLYKLNTSDILVTLDADCRMGSQFVLSALVEPFRQQGVGLVGGNDTPSKPENFFESIVNTGILLWYETRRDINGGACVYNHHGCVSALSADLCKQLDLPKDLVAGDTYLYFKALELGFSFQFAKAAVVYYHTPDNWRDYAAQSSRFWQSKSQISGYFGPWIQQERKVPLKNKLKALVKVFFQKPLSLLLVLSLRILLKLRQLKKPDAPSPVWASVASTKREF